MATFEFSTASRIIFGSGTIENAEKMIAALGETCLLVSGEIRPTRFLPVDRDGQSTVKPGGFLGLISI
jgi:hypothetical protein